MTRFEPLGRLALPLLAGVFGALLYIVSPLSHQAFCSPMHIPVLVAPEGSPLLSVDKP